MRRKALVLGEDSRSFLAAVRSLGRADIEVHVGWHRAGAAALRSRYIAKLHELPPFDERDGSWKEALIGLVRDERFDLVIPCHDSSLVPLQEHRKDLEPHGRFYLLSDETFAIFFDKIRTNELARSVGVRVPREVIVGSMDEVDDIRRSFTLPLVLKPRSSFNPENPNSRHIVRKAYTWEDFDQYLRGMLASGSVAVQENIRGFGVGVELLLNRGEPLMVFQHRRLHEPPRGGGSSYRMSVAVTPALLDASLKLLKPLTYTGVAMVEFKVDPRTNDWALMEVNGRFWGSLPLAIAAGADFPYALFELLVEGRSPPRIVYKEGICCRNWEADFWWLIENLQSDRTDETLNTRPLSGVLVESIKSLVLLKERSDTLTRDDPWPGLAELAQLALSAGGRIRRKFSRRCLELGAIRRRLRLRAHAALGRARSILFVCHGNICRSPFAAEIAQGRSTDRAITSAGYHPRPDRPAPEQAVAAAASWDVDLSRHRSQVLDDSLVRWADVILVFDHANYEQVVGDFPSARDRVHLVGALSTHGPLFIDDPWGKDLADFERCYRDIVHSLAGPLIPVDPRPHD